MPFVVVVVIECLHLYGEQELLHRGQDEFLYRSLQRRFVVPCICGSRGQVDTVVKIAKFSRRINVQPQINPDAA